MEWIKEGDKETVKLPNPHQDLLLFGIVFGAGNYLFFLLKSSEVNAAFHIIHIGVVIICLFLLLLKKTKLVFHSKENWLMINNKRINLTGEISLREVATHAGTRVRLEIYSNNETVKISAGKNQGIYSEKLKKLIEEKLGKSF